MRREHTVRRLAPLALALVLPLLKGCPCGIQLDYGETHLITESVDLIVMDVDDGNLDVVAYARDGILLRRHTYAWEKRIIAPSYAVEDGVGRFAAHCEDNDDDCSFDHWFELPFGIGFDITMDDARIDMGYMDADITASFDVGYFNGVQLATPRLEITANSADVYADYTAAPESIVLDLDRGDVTLWLPAGEYQCRLDASSGEATVEGGVVCNDAAAAVLDIRLGVGDILVTEAVP